MKDSRTRGIQALRAKGEREAVGDARKSGCILYQVENKTAKIRYAGLYEKTKSARRIRCGGSEEKVKLGGST